MWSRSQYKIGYLTELVRVKPAEKNYITLELEPTYLALQIGEIII
jgi:hypothetical protein